MSPAEGPDVESESTKTPDMWKLSEPSRASCTVSLAAPLTGEPRPVFAVTLKSSDRLCEKGWLVSLLLWSFVVLPLKYTISLRYPEDIQGTHFGTAAVYAEILPADAEATKM